MKSLYSALQLKRLLTLKELGVEYIDSIEEFKEPELTLPDNLDMLKKVMDSCHMCQLSKSRTNIVFGEGSLNSKIMFVGEAPNSNEDNVGKVFMGRSGELLTKMIENVLHIPKESVYITNIIKCLPLNKKAPTSSEILSCKPYLQKQIDIIKPKIIVALGATAYSYLTNDNTPIERIRGNILNFNTTRIITTYHPNYLLRNPSAKKETFADMLKIKDFLETI